MGATSLQCAIRCIFSLVMPCLCMHDDANSRWRYPSFVYSNLLGNLIKIQDRILKDDCKNSCCYSLGHDTPYALAQRLLCL